MFEYNIIALLTFVKDKLLVSYPQENFLIMNYILFKDGLHALKIKDFGLSPI